MEPMLTISTVGVSVSEAVSSVYDEREGGSSIMLCSIDVLTIFSLETTASNVLVADLAAKATAAIRLSLQIALHDECIGCVVS